MGECGDVGVCMWVCVGWGCAFPQYVTTSTPFHTLLSPLPSMLSNTLQLLLVHALTFLTEAWVPSWREFCLTFFTDV